METKCESYKYINSENRTSQMESGGPNVIRTHDLPVISRALQPG